MGMSPLNFQVVPSFTATAIVLYPLRESSLAFSITSSTLIPGHMAAKTCGAPFVTVIIPSGVSTFACVLFVAGSKGVKSVILYPSIFTPADFPKFMIARSIESRLDSSDASMAYLVISSLEDSNRTGSCTVSSFFVSVPVLSKHMESMEAASSTAFNLVTSAPFFERSIAPYAVAIVNVAGRATGIDAIRTTSEKGMASIRGTL